MPKRTLIRGGEVVTPTDRFRADVLIEGERITALGDGAQWDADTIVDAAGCLVMPGGVDTHTHLEHMSANGLTRTADDFHSGTVSAAFGGTTTIVDFVRARPDQGMYDAFQRRLESAEAQCVVDFGFHPIVPPTAGDATFDELARLAREGATSWKFFMSYPGTMVDDRVLIQGFRRCAEEGVLPMVHAENGTLVADATQRLLSDNQTAEHQHHAAHSHVAEREAVHRAVTIAESVGSPLFVVHVSSRLAAEEIARHQARDFAVFGETCPQYLLTSYEDYAGLGFEAAAYVCSPPIRERANQEDLWHALQTGVISTLGTDHAAFTLSQPDDLPPQKPQGRGYFPKIPNGVPGVEDRLMVIWEAGVVGGRFDVHRFVDLVATRPAKLFGLYPRKGTLTPGSDADVLVWDPAADHTITAAGHHTRADYNLYEGMRVSGRPRHVLSRGDIVVSDGELHAPAGRGRYLARATSDTSR
ncbi:dihydropyrimidinase [Actinopolymorpha alba]|uniref:dihydropyrimidinase n=1 Tax=Actinopolymorpha alba TaxID=533267 RepID=UPI00037E4F86|nr:dihydropyrimidinase [Actinopolymorpha alba]